jgi:hypothetical protein
VAESPVGALAARYEMTPATRDFGYMPKVSIAEGLERLGGNVQAGLTATARSHVSLARGDALQWNGWRA